MEKESLKILVMDDENFIRDILGKMLEYLGYRVQTTKRGKDAIEEYLSVHKKGKSFDLVILDLVIPGGRNGIEVLEELKKINPDIIAIASSGYSNENPEGFSAFLGKHYGVEDLKKALEDATQ